MGIRLIENIVRIRLGRLHDGIGGIFGSIISQLDFDSQADAIRDLIITITNIQPSSVTRYDWAPSAGIGYFEYCDDNIKPITLKKYFFNLRKQSSEITFAISDSPTKSFCGRSGRLRLIECLVKDDNFKAMSRLCNITGMSVKSIKRDLDDIAQLDLYYVKI